MPTDVPTTPLPGDSMYSDRVNSASWRDGSPHAPSPIARGNGLTTSSADEHRSTHRPPDSGASHDTAHCGGSPDDHRNHRNAADFRSNDPGGARGAALLLRRPVRGADAALHRAEPGDLLDLRPRTVDQRRDHALRGWRRPGVSDPR